MTVVSVPHQFDEGDQYVDLQRVLGSPSVTKGGDVLDTRRPALWGAGR